MSRIRGTTAVALSALLAACTVSPAERPISENEALQVIEVAKLYADKVYRIDCRNGTDFRFAVHPAANGRLIAEVRRKSGMDGIRVEMRRSDLAVVQAQRFA